MKRSSGLLTALLLSASLLVQSLLPGTMIFASNQQSLTYEYPEQEPNNTLEDNQRYPLQGGETFVFTGTVSGIGFEDDPVDYYPFEVAKSGYMTAVLKETATANLLHVDIVDDSENELDDDYLNPVNEQHNVYLEAGRQYFVRAAVRPEMIGSGFQYRLQVSFLTERVDAFEPNDSKENAAVTTLGQSSSSKINGAIQSAADQDWYQFEADDTGYFKLGLQSIPDGAAYDFNLYTQDGIFLASTANRTEKMIHNVYGSRTQKFFVQVYSTNGFNELDGYELYRTFTSSYDIMAGDFYESNNTIGAASVTSFGQTQSELTQGTIHVPNDEDWYEVKLSQSGNFQVGLVYTPSPNYHMELYEEDGDLLYTTENSESHTPKQFGPIYGERDDIFYIKVFATRQEHTPTEDYEIEVTLIDGDAYEPNNTRETYSSSPLGRSNVEYITATLHNENDVDWYSVSPHAAGYFRAVMTTKPASGYQMKLYNENMQEVGTHTTINGQQAITDVFGMKGGAFFLKVYSTGGSSRNPYSIMVNVDYPNSWTTESENNNSFETANALIQGDEMRGTIPVSTDRDYYKLRASGAGTVHFSLDSPDRHDYNLLVFDENKNQIGEMIHRGTNSDYILDVPVNNNMFYVLVYPAFGSNVSSEYSYRLRAISYMSQGDPYENNDTIGRATEASVTDAARVKEFKGTIHSGADFDYYKVRNDSLPFDLQLTLAGIPAGTNYDMKVVDDAGNTIASAHNSGNTDESLSVVIPKNKTYYVAVFSSGGGFNKDVTYRLTVKKNGVVPIIIVPGFGGTALFGTDPSEDKLINVWMNFGVSDTAKLMYQNYYDQAQEAEIGLHYKDLDAGLWDITDVAPESLMLDQDIYFRDMISDLKAQGYFAGFSLFGLPYNFIRDNTDASELLKRRIDHAMQKTGSSKVMLISHSNGGLIVKEAVLDPNYTNKVSKWVTLGTPWLGAPASLKAWIDGYDLDIPVLSDEVGRNLAMHSPSAYGLLPSRAYHDIYGNVLSYYKRKNFFEKELVKVDDYDKMVNLLTNVNKGQLSPYLNFREDLFERAQSKHNTMYDLAQTSIPLYIIAGYGMNTVGNYTYVQAISDVSEMADNGSIVIPNYVSGDGTVPEHSGRGTATHRVGTNNTKIYGVTGVEHMPLVKDPRNREQVKQILIYGNEAPTSGIRLESHYLDGKHTNYLTNPSAPQLVTATVFSIPLTGQESRVTLTLKNGEKTVIKLNADKTYFAEKQASHVTIDNVNNTLWIAAPVDLGTVMSWSGENLTGVKVYDLLNGMYRTSYKVTVTGTTRSFTVSNSVAQPNRFKGVTVEESGVYEESDAPTEAYE